MDPILPIGGGVVLKAKMSGAPWREHEPTNMAAVVRQLGYKIVETDRAEIMFEGGDCLRTYDWLGAKEYFFVGLGVRTNMYAHEYIRQNIRQVHGDRAVLCSINPKPGLAIHISSDGGLPGPSQKGNVCAVVNPNHWGERGVASLEAVGLKVFQTTEGDGCGGGVVRIGNKVVVASGYPQLCDKLAAEGFDLLELPLDEITKGEAAAHCPLAAIN